MHRRSRCLPRILVTGLVRQTSFDRGIVEERVVGGIEVGVVRHDGRGS